MERIVLLRSCHPIAASSPCALPTVGDELHITIAVANGDSLASTPIEGFLGGGGGGSGCVATSEPIAEDLLGVNKALGGSAVVHTVKIPLSDYNGRVVIEDVTSGPIFHPDSEISIVCVLHTQGVASASPLFTAYTKVGSFQPTCHSAVQLIQHVGLRVVNESTGVCMTLAKAPIETDRAIEGALATEHLRCYHDHVVQWQLERALHTKNAAVDELIQSDILLSDEIKRQRQAIDGQSHYDPLSASGSAGGDEACALRGKIKELELERVKELEAMRRLIAERRAEREAHIEARLKESKPPAMNSSRSHTSAPARPSVGSAGVGRATPLRNTTPGRGATPQRSTGGGSVAGSRPGMSTPTRGTVSVAASGRGGTPNRSVTGGVPASAIRTPQRSSTPTRGAPMATPSTANRRPSVTPGNAKTPSTAATPAQAAMLKRAEDNLQRLRTSGGAAPSPASGPSRVGGSALTGRQSPCAGARNASPMPTRSVPPPPPDIRSSPMRVVPGGSSAATPTPTARRTLVETPTRSTTPSKGTSTAGAGARAASPLMKSNTQSLIRMARQ